jgi:hypothetical protein
VITQIKFQYYPAKVKSNKPLGFVSLGYFLNAQKNPKPETKKIFEAIVMAEESGNMELKSDLKQNNLYYFTPCVTLRQYRRYSDIISFTGLLVLDFDHIDNAVDFKEFIFNEYKFIVTCWLSPSKKGVKAIVNIPISKYVDEFKQYYYALTNIFDVYDGWDPSNKNAVLPLFQSYDEDLLFREDPELFTQKAIDPNSLPKDPVHYSMPANIQGKERLIYKIAESGIKDISSPGHPQLRSICIALGGYVATGYIDKLSIILHVDNLIKSNAYLQKGVKGYQQTARWAIDEGMKKPIVL